MPAAYGQFPKESGEEPNMEEGLQHGGSSQGGRCGQLIRYNMHWGIAIFKIHIKQSPNSLIIFEWP